MQLPEKQEAGSAKKPEKNRHAMYSFLVFYELKMVLDGELASIPLNQLVPADEISAGKSALLPKAAIPYTLLSVIVISIFDNLIRYIYLILISCCIFPVNCGIITV